MTVIFKHLPLRKVAWSIKAKFYVEPFGEVGASIYKYGLCNMTKMAVMSHMVIMLKIFISGT